MGGALAHTFGKLVEEMWTCRKGSISPSAFKRDIGHLNSLFDGSDQHDAQELLSFLLDGLSEDLNLVCVPLYTMKLSHSADSHSSVTTF